MKPPTDGDLPSQQVATSVGPVSNWSNDRLASVTVPDLPAGSAPREKHANAAR